MLTDEQIAQEVQRLVEAELADWLDTFSIDGYRRWLSGQGQWIVAGGTIGRVLRGDEPSDFDIFFLEGPPYLRPLVNTDSTQYDRRNARLGRLHFVGKHLGTTPEDVVRTFDYLHCQAWWDPGKCTVGWLPGARAAAQRKALVKVGPGQYPDDAELNAHRLKKFMAQGFKPLHQKEMRGECNETHTVRRHLSGARSRLSNRG